MTHAFTWLHSARSAYFETNPDTTDLTVIELADRFPTSTAAQVYAETRAGIRQCNGSRFVYADLMFAITCHEITSSPFGNESESFEFARSSTRSAPPIVHALIGIARRGDEVLVVSLQNGLGGPVDRRLFGVIMTRAAEAA